MRRILFYSVSLTCALAINIALISLLVFASPRIPLSTDYKLSPQTFSLSLKDTCTTREEKIQQTAMTKFELPNVQAAQTSTILTKPSEHVPSIPVKTSLKQKQIKKNTLENDVFFSRGQQILASLEEKAPKHVTTEKKTTTVNHFSNSKTHCYCSKTLNHITTYYLALRKKYARSLAQWYEQPSSKPDVTIHVEKTGSLKSILLTKSSGSRMHDKLYVQAIKQAAPFPKIPEHFNVNELVFEL